MPAARRWPAGWGPTGPSRPGTDRRRRPDHQADRQVPEGAVPGAPADPLQRQAQSAVFGGLDGQTQRAPARRGRQQRPRPRRRPCTALAAVKASGAASRPVRPSSGTWPLAATRPRATPTQTSSDQDTVLRVSASRAGADGSAVSGRHQQLGQLQQEPEQDRQPGNPQQRSPRAAGRRWPAHGCLRSIDWRYGAVELAARR